MPELDSHEGDRSKWVSHCVKPTLRNTCIRCVVLPRCLSRKKSADIDAVPDRLCEE